MSQGWYTLPCCTSAGSWDDWRSLLFRLEQMHTKTCVLMFFNLQEALIYDQKISKVNLSLLLLLCSTSLVVSNLCWCQQFYRFFENTFLHCIDYMCTRCIDYILTCLKGSEVSSMCWLSAQVFTVARYH